MNIRGLLLGSAAALVGVSGAQAADAVVVADPEPVEYVRVCDVYGTGYFYIPGTETCLRVGGYVRYQVSGGDLFANVAVDHLNGTLNDTYNQYARFSFQTWTGTETELGTLKTFTETRFNWAPGGQAVVGDADVASGTSVSLNFAWIELGGFRVGKDESAYDTFLGYAGNVIADDLVPYGNFDTNLISYTFTSGAFSAIIAAESGETDEYNGHDMGIDSYVPHVVAGAKFTQGWGGIGLVGAYDSIHEEWAVKGRLDVTANDQFSGFLMGAWATRDNTAEGFNFYAPWGGDWALWAGMTYKATEKAAINVQVSYDDAETFGAAANVEYELVPGFKITPEVDYKKVETVAGSDDAFGGILRFQRSF